MRLRQRHCRAPFPQLISDSSPLESHISAADVALYTIDVDKLANKGIESLKIR